MDPTSQPFGIIRTALSGKVSNVEVECNFARAAGQRSAMRGKGHGLSSMAAKHILSEMVHGFQLCHSDLQSSLIECFQGPRATLAPLSGQSDNAGQHWLLLLVSFVSIANSAQNMQSLPQAAMSVRNAAATTASPCSPERQCRIECLCPENPRMIAGSEF
jgi:hypothetical protein